MVRNLPFLKLFNDSIRPANSLSSVDYLMSEFPDKNSSKFLKKINDITSFLKYCFMGPKATRMKTRLYLSLLTLFFSVSALFSQITQMPDLRECGYPNSYDVYYTCKSNNYTLNDVFLSLTNVNGVPISNTSCEIGVTPPKQVYVLLNYTSNSSSDIYNVRLTADLVINETPLFINAWLGTVNPGFGQRQLYGPFTWNCGDEITLSSPLVNWTTNNSKNLQYSYTCGDYTKSQCELPGTIQVSAPLAIKFNATVPSCFSSSDNLVNFTSSVNGGKAPYTYKWYINNATTPFATTENTSYSFINSGSYDVKLIVTDAAGTNGTVINQVIIPSPINLDTVITNSSGCTGNNNGAIVLNVSGGTPNYSYLWSNGATTKDLSNIVAGTYSVTVTDSKGCIKTLSGITVTTVDLLAVSANAASVICSGSSTTLTAIANGGTTPYTYSIDGLNFQSSNTFTVGSGNFTVTVKDSKGCLATSTITINSQSLPPSAGTNGTLTICAGTTVTAQQLFAALGGSPAAGGTWSPALAGAGVYTYTQSATAPCTTDNTATVTVSEQLVTAVASNKINVTCYGGNDGSVVITPSGGTAPYSISPSQFGLSAGIHTFTVTDSVGCTTSINVTILDGDSIPPVISQLPAETTIECSVTPVFAIPTVTDNVTVSPSLTYSDVTTPGVCQGSYSITRTWIAKDDCGNTSTASQTINLVDTTAPTFTKPADITIYKDDNCSFDASLSKTGNVTNISDNCDASAIATYTDKNCFGTSNIQNVNAGNGNYYYFTINGFSSLSAKDIKQLSLTFQTNQGKGRAEFTLVAPNGQGIILVGPYCTGGNCDDSSANNFETYSPTFYPNNSGYTKWINSNAIPEGTGNFTPNGSLTSPNSANIVGLTSYVSKFEDFTGSMDGQWFIYTRKQQNVNGSIRFNSVCLTPADLACPDSNIIVRHWTVKDACNNNVQFDQVIKVVDNTAPVLTIPADVTVECDSIPQVGTPTATDNCDQEVTIVYNGEEKVEGSCTNSYVLKRTWTATDNCGNSTTKTQTITIIDTKAPVAPPAPSAMTYECMADVPVAEELTAVDNCQGDITVTGVDSVDNTDPCNVVITRTWTFTDSCSNSSSVSQTITVKDTTAPVAPEAPSAMTFECLADVPTLVTLTAQDNCAGEITVTGVDSVNAINISTKEITRTWTFTDNCNNSTSISQLITVIIPNAPEVLCYQTATWNPENCEYDITGVQPTEPAKVNCWDNFVFNTETCQWDNTGVQPTEPAKVNCWDNFVFNTETCQWDNTGVQPTEPAKVNCWDNFVFNTETCQWDNTGVQPQQPIIECWQQITFNFETCQWNAPTGTQVKAVCKSITVELNNQGTATITPSMIDGGSVGTGTLTLTASKLTFTCADVGTNKVTLTVTDSCGTSTCEAIVTVVDKVAPTVFCQNITVELDQNNIAVITPQMIDNGSFDACGIASYSLDIDTFGFEDIGDNPVVLTVTDVNGNVSTCTAIVTVGSVGGVAACLTIFNEFSPNQDGYNDYFYIKCVELYPNNRLEVFNRWGNKVYEKQNYNNTWDGTANTGNVINKNAKLPVGTYYYVFDLGDGTKPLSGWLYIQR